MIFHSEPKMNHAIISILNCGETSVRYDEVYGGEILLNRSLVALSKSGFQYADLIVPYGHKKNVETVIRKIRKRIHLTVTIHEMTSSETLLPKLNRIIGDWNEPFLMFDLAGIYYASLFESINQLNADTPQLVCFQNVTWSDNGLHFDEGFQEKYKTIFHYQENLTRVSIKNNRITFEAHSEKDPAYFSTDMLICRKEDLSTVSEAVSIRDILEQFGNMNRLNAGWVNNVGWLKIHKNASKDYVNNFFWKIAFKEISGEFSKAVNSKLSKPLSFAFARLGFTPNVISIIAFLFLIGSSLLLFFDNYWMLVLSGLLWQMAAVLDRCDGEVARIRSYESAFGAQFDILTDDLGYAVQFICLTAVCFMQSHYDPFCPIVSALTFMWILRAVLYEKEYMRAAGYQSRQVKHMDFLKRLKQDSVFVRIFKNIEIFARRDWRAVLYFLLTLTGSKMLIFWTFLIFGWILGLFVYIQIHILSQPLTINNKSVST